jgi:hypothetical protein
VDAVVGDDGDVFANDGNMDFIDFGGGSNDIVRYDVGLDSYQEVRDGEPASVMN